jgi:hypothetical protein
LAINSVNQVNITSLKQNNTSASTSAKKTGKLYHKLSNKEASKVKDSLKADTIEISEEGMVMAGILTKNDLADKNK